MLQKLDKSQDPEPQESRPGTHENDRRCRSGARNTVCPGPYGTDGIGYNVQEVKKALGENAPVDELGAGVRSG